jgi:RNA polymerase sigma-70 factor (ECF subfamily)
MFRRQSDLRALSETDDVVQQALVRLYRALATVQPPTVRAYFGLAARQIRWVLQDMARKLATAKVVRYADALPAERLHDPADEPSNLLEWCEFHERVNALPDEQREVFDLLLYQGLPQAEAAALLGISVRSVKRLWQQARLRLRDHYPGREGEAR